MHDQTMILLMNFKFSFLLFMYYFATILSLHQKRSIVFRSLLSSSRLIAILELFIRSSTTSFLIPFICSCCSLVIKLLSLPPLEWSSVRFTDDVFDTSIRILITSTHSLVYVQMKSVTLKDSISDDTKDPVNTVYHDILIHSFSCSELVQHFSIQIWLLLIQLLPATIACLQESILQQFITSTLEISISMSTFNDHDGLSKQFFMLLVEQSSILPHCSFHELLSFLLHYQGLTSNIPSFILILLNKYSLESEECQHIFMFGIFVSMSYRFLLEQVYLARVKSDYIDLLNKLLKQWNPVFVDIFFFFYI